MSYLDYNDAVLAYQHGSQSFREHVNELALEEARDRYGALKTLETADENPENPFAFSTLENAMYYGELADLFGTRGNYYVHEGEPNPDAHPEDVEWKDFEHNFRAEDIIPIIGLEPHQDGHVYYQADGFVNLVMLEIVNQIQMIVKESHFSPRNFVAAVLRQEHPEKKVAELMDVSIGNVRGKKHDAKQNVIKSVKTAKIGSVIGVRSD